MSNGDTILLCCVPLLIAFFVMFAIETGKRQKQQVMEKAGAKYHKLLDDLALDPKNNALRRETLQAGRDYLAKVRDFHGEKKAATVFDELHLNNDLMAISPDGH